jgi:hypothetical protein
MLKAEMENTWGIPGTIFREKTLGTAATESIQKQPETGKL